MQRWWISFVHRSSKFFEGYYANLLHSGDTKEADNPIDNIICRHSDI